MTPRSPAAFVLFDIGGVLVDVARDRAARRWVELGFEASRFEAAFEGSGAKRDGDLGRLDVEGMRARVEAGAGAPVSRTALLDVWGAMVTWRPWVTGLVGRLAVPYGVLSTIDPVHAEVLGPLPGADPVVYSCDIGAVKPASRAFEVAIARSPAPARRIRYVDDRAENVEAGAAAGLQAVRVHDRATLQAALADVLGAPP